MDTRMFHVEQADDGLSLLAQMSTAKPCLSSVAGVIYIDLRITMTRRLRKEPN